MRAWLRLYPRAWRQRYEAEMLALLEAHGVSWATRWDLLWGAVDAWVWPLSGTQAARRRSGTVFMFIGFLIFGVGWAVLQRLSDPLPTYLPIAHQTPLLPGLFDAVRLAGYLAALAFFAGGLPVVASAAKKALTLKRRQVLMPLAAALAAAAVFFLATLVVALWHPLHHLMPILLSYLALSAGLLVCGAVAVILVLARSDFEPAAFRWTVPSKRILWPAMLVSGGSSLLLYLVILAEAPTLLYSQDVTSPLFLVGLGLMLVGSLVTALGRRVWADPLPPA